MDDLKFRNTCFTFESTVALLYGVRNGTVTQDSINDHKFHNYANSFVKLFGRSKFCLLFALIFISLPPV